MAFPFSVLISCDVQADTSILLMKEIKESGLRVGQCYKSGLSFLLGELGVTYIPQPPVITLQGHVTTALSQNNNMRSSGWGWGRGSGMLACRRRLWCPNSLQVPREDGWVINSLFTWQPQKQNCCLFQGKNLQKLDRKQSSVSWLSWLDRFPHYNGLM